MKPKNKKMSFGDYFDSLRNKPKAFILEIADICGVSERTVYNWISGVIIPDTKHQEKISEKTGIPAKYLFKQWELIDHTK